MSSARLLGLAAAFLLASGLSAQSCLTPHATRAWIGARIARTSLEQYLVGADAGVRARSWLTLRGEVDQVRFDAPTPSRTRAWAGAMVAVGGMPLPVCLTGSGMITRMGDLTVLTLPVGVVTGWSASLGEGGSTLTSWLEPRVSYRRASLAGFHSVSAPFSMLAGSGVAAGRMYGGIHLEWTPRESGGWAAGIRAAYAL